MTARPAWAGGGGPVAVLGRSRTAVRRPVAVGVVVVLLVTSAVTAVVLRRAEARGPVLADRVAVAVSFAEAVTSADPVARDAAIGRWVLPQRVPQFVAAFDRAFAGPQQKGVRLVATVRRYRVVTDVAGADRVLVWSEVRTGAGGPQGEISAFGVTFELGRWWVFSYEGTLAGVGPDDDRLRDFREVERVVQP